MRWFFGLLLLTSCCHPPAFLSPKTLHRHIYISNEFSSEEVVDIEEGLAEWEEKTNGGVCFEVSKGFSELYPLPKSSDSLLILNKQPSFPLIVALDKVFQAKGTLTFGYYQERSAPPAIYLVSSRINNRGEFVALVLHEVGHSLGLEHSPEQGSVMFEYLDYAAWHLTEQDIDTFCALHYCPGKD